MLENMEKVSDYIPNLGTDTLHLLAFKSYRSQFNHQMVGLVLVYQCGFLLYAVQIYGYEPETTLAKLMLIGDRLAQMFNREERAIVTIAIVQCLRAMCGVPSFYQHAYCLGAYEPCPKC